MKTADRTRTAVFVVALSVTLPLHVSAAQLSDSGPRTTFVVALYGSRGARALYAGYGVGSWQGIIAVLENPHTDYLEALVGVAKRFMLAPHQSITVALAAAEAKDSRYGQIYVVPAISAGRLTLTGTAVIYAPLQTQGAFQYYLHPLSLHVALSTLVQPGVSYDLAGQEQAATGHALGPSLRLGVPHGAVTIDWLVGLAAYSTETRLTFQTTL